DYILRNDVGKLSGLEGSGLRAIQYRLRPKRAVVGQDQFHVQTPPQRAKQLEAIDGREASRFPAQPSTVEVANRRVADSWRFGAVNRPVAWLDHSGGLILEPGLIGGHFARLRRPRPTEVLLALPALP